MPPNCIVQRCRHLKAKQKGLWVDLGLWFFWSVFCHKSSAGFLSDVVQKSDRLVRFKSRKITQQIRSRSGAIVERNLTRDGLMKKLLVVLFLACGFTGVSLSTTQAPVAAQTTQKHYRNYVAQGGAAMKSKDYTSAIAAFQQAVNLIPERAKAHGELGYAYLKAKNYDKAIEHTEKAIALAKKDKIKGALYYNLGLAYEKLGDNEHAVESYEESLLVRPGNKTVKKAVARAQKAWEEQFRR